MFGPHSSVCMTQLHTLALSSLLLFIPLPFFSLIPIRCNCLKRCHMCSVVYIICHAKIFIIRKCLLSRVGVAQPNTVLAVVLRYVAFVSHIRPFRWMSVFFTSLVDGSEFLSSFFMAHYLIVEM